MSNIGTLDEKLGKKTSRKKKGRMPGTRMCRTNVAPALQFVKLTPNDGEWGVVGVDPTAVTRVGEAGDNVVPGRPQELKVADSQLSSSLHLPANDLG